MAPCIKVHQIPSGVALEAYCTCLLAKFLGEVDLSYLFLFRIGGCQGERYASITFFAQNYGITRIFFSRTGAKWSHAARYTGTTDR